LPGEVEPGLPHAPLWADTIMVAMARDHPLAGQARIAPEQVREEIVLVSRQQHGADRHRFLSGRILPDGPALNGILLDLSQTRLLGRVANGDGVALVCAGDADDADGRVVLRAVDTPAAAFTVHACWRDPQPGWPLSSLLDMLVERRAAGERDG
jgi:DNA-binding transcriptional LysR family regulator